MFWLRPAATQAGNIITLLNGANVILTIELNADNKITLNIPGTGFSMTSSTALTLNAWTQCAVRLSGSQASILVNGATSSSAITRSVLAASECRLGGINGQMDEFMFSDRITNPLPDVPLQGTLSLSEVGGFGTGSLGNVTIATNCIINTYAPVTSINRGAKTLSFDASKLSIGRFGDFAVNSEVMLIDSEGRYLFRTLTAYNANSGTMSFSDFDSLPSSFTGTVSDIQVILIPNFNTFTINPEITVSPLAWTGYCGGIVAFRVKGDCTINGSIITSGKGRLRQDMLQLTHAKLIDNFIQNTGGAIFITCGGTFTAPSTARIGATWDGAATAGVASTHADGGNGGAGYGGGGTAGSVEYGYVYKAGNGGVGGGGGSAVYVPSQAYDAGGAQLKDEIRTGGQGYCGGAGNNYRMKGGTQGVTPGANAETQSNYSNISYAPMGGAGAGGAHPVNRQELSGYSGANLILIVNKLKADASAISTGGKGGHYYGGNNIAPTGGGGTGFAYIAAKSLV